MVYIWPLLPDMTHNVIKYASNVTSLLNPVNSCVERTKTVVLGISQSSTVVPRKKYVGRGQKLKMCEEGQQRNKNMWDGLAKFSPSSPQDFKGNNR